MTEEPSADRRSTLEKAGLPVMARSETQGGVLYEIDPASTGGRPSLVFDNGRFGITVAIRVEIPDESELAKAPPDSNSVLCFLGAVTLSLQGRDTEAKLIMGDSGLEAVLLSRHVCANVGAAEDVSSQMSELRELASDIQPALIASPAETLIRIRADLSAVTSALASRMPEEEGRLVPTFDEEARNRMMQA